MEEAWGRTEGGGRGVTGGRTEGEDRLGRMWRTRGRTGKGLVGGSR